MTDAEGDGTAAEVEAEVDEEAEEEEEEEEEEQYDNSRYTGIEGILRALAPGHIRLVRLSYLLRLAKARASYGSLTPPLNAQGAPHAAQQ